MLNQLLQALLVLFGLTGVPQEPLALPGPEYHWTGLGAWAAANMKADLGFDCGKLVWLPDRTKPTLTPLKILWEASDPDEPIPQHILDSYPQVIVSVALTKECPIRGPPAALVASPAILLKSSTSPWTVDATFNTASNTIYAVGPGGNGGDAVANATSGGGGGAGAAVFASNYNNSWTPGTSTATFQVTGANTTTTVNNASFQTKFDLSAFVASPGSSGNGNGKGFGGTIANSVVPTGGTKHSGGDGGNGASFATAGGGGGGGAAGTTANGAAGADAPATGTKAGSGGGGADGGNPGVQATGVNGANGGVSGLGGSTAGAGAVKNVSVATSGTLGAGGGGGAQGGTVTFNPGADGSSGGTQFDATHGAGGGGGGGGTSNTASKGNGGNGGSYGGGGGGAGTQLAVGTVGTGGNGIVFITWIPAASGVIYSPMTPMTGGGRITVLEWIGKAVNDNVISWLEAS